MQPFKHILVATDFSEQSDRAIQLATDLATAFHSSLTLLHVYESSDALYSERASYWEKLVEPLLEEAESKLAQRVQSIGQEIPEVGGKIRHGIPYEQILVAARDYGADLIVMGTHGRKGLARTLLGSVAEKVVRYSSVPVLTIRQPARERTVSSARDSKRRIRRVVAPWSPPARARGSR